MQSDERTQGGNGRGRRAARTAEQVKEALERAFPDAIRTGQAREAAEITLKETQRYLHMLEPDELGQDLPLLLEALLEGPADDRRRRTMLGYVIDHLNVLCDRPEEDYAGIEALMGSDLAAMAREDATELAEAKQEQYASFTREQATAIVDWLSCVQENEWIARRDSGALMAATRYWRKRQEI